MESSEPFTLGRDDEFHVLRALAIETHSRVEAALAQLLAALLHNDRQAASIIFYRVTNAKSRTQIIESLLKARTGSKFTHYWFGIPNTKGKGLMSLVHGVDGQRNEIAHWHTMTHIADAGTGTPEKPKTVLAKPDFWLGAETYIDKTALNAFIKKADFVARSINMFTALNFSLFGDVSTPDAWQGIFQQPCSYPPPNSHPLSKSA